jgi:2-haloacid dehalogenase
VNAVQDIGRYEVVSFECYGTLSDWENGLVSGLRPLHSNHGLNVTDDEILDLQARTEHRLQSGSTRGNYTKYRDVLRQEVREAGKRWGFEPYPSEIDALADSVRHWRPFPDTVEALKAIKAVRSRASLTSTTACRPDGSSLGGGIRLDNHVRASADLQASL